LFAIGSELSSTTPSPSSVQEVQTFEQSITMNLPAFSFLTPPAPPGFYSLTEIRLSSLFFLFPKSQLFIHKKMFLKAGEMQALTPATAITC
jgi:hypothetical protein